MHQRMTLLHSNTVDTKPRQPYQVRKTYKGKTKVIAATDDRELATKIEGAVDLLLSLGVIQFDDLRESTGLGLRPRRGITIEGVKMPLKEWCAKLNLNYGSVVSRATRKGIPTEDALKQVISEKGIDIKPIVGGAGDHKAKIALHGLSYTLFDWCGILDIPLLCVIDAAKDTSIDNALTQLIAERGIDVPAILESLKSTFK